MYKFYLGSDFLVPVTPSKMTMKIRNNNETLVLINEGEINMPKAAGLTDVSFDMILPIINNYPFAVYSDGFQTASVYLEKLEKLKTSKEAFQFVVSRIYEKKSIFSTDMKCTLEDYEIVEDAGSGDCIKVSVSLKQYREYSTKTVKITSTSSGTKASTTSTRASSTSSAKKTSSNASSKKKSVTKGCTVIVNGYLYRDSYQNGRGQYRQNYKGKVNFIKNGRKCPYHITTPSGGWQGWVIKSAVQVV